MLTKNSKYYKQGYDSYYDGYAIDTNPHKPDTDNYENWDNGFKAAEQEMEFQKNEEFLEIFA